MIGPLRVLWWPRATEDWRRLRFEDAKAVARAVRVFAGTGAGIVVYVEGEYRLFVGEFVVVFLIEGDAMHIDRVRRACGTYRNSEDTAWQQDERTDFTRR